MLDYTRAGAVIFNAFIRLRVGAGAGEQKKKILTIRKKGFTYLYLNIILFIYMKIIVYI